MSLFDGDEFGCTSSMPPSLAATARARPRFAGTLTSLGDDAAVTQLEPATVPYLLAGTNDVSVSRLYDELEYRFIVDVDHAVGPAPNESRDEVAALIESGDAPARADGSADVAGDGRVHYVPSLHVDGVGSVAGRSPSSWSQRRRGRGRCHGPRCVPSCRKRTAFRTR